MTITNTSTHHNRIMLAPMEGVVDVHMREFLTEIGGYDRCVTEFIRVVDQIYPPHVFTRFCPELLNDGRTKSGVPVYTQLLGSNPTAMAQNAKKAAALGALGIDVNFGCPSKTVNQSDGGSAVLREPKRVAEILTTIRDTVSHDTPVTAKIRLGFDHCEDFSAIIDAINASGVDELCIHARTKKQGYKPPAHWNRAVEARKKLHIPVIINGEIWNSDDADEAKKQSHCHDIMLGRGAIACPDLALQIIATEQQQGYQPIQWPEVWDKVRHQALMLHQEMPRYVGMRTKQWLRYLILHYPEAQQTFERIKYYKTVAEMISIWD